MRVDLTVIGASIRAARERRGWSQSQLGRRLGVSHSAVSLVELGRSSVDVLTLGEYADVLGCPMALLFSTPGDARADLGARLMSLLPALDESEVETLGAWADIWSRRQAVKVGTLENAVVNERKYRS